MTIVLFLILFRSIYHARTLISRYYHPCINMLKKGIDPNNNSGIQRFSHFHLPTKYQCMTDVTNVIPLNRFFTATVVVDYWYHAFTYIPAQHGFVRSKRDAISFVMVGLLYDIANAHVQSKIKHPYSPMCFALHKARSQ